jgi:hypothetical protein
MKNYKFQLKDGTVLEGNGHSGLNAWHRLGYSTYWWDMLIYCKEI